jgi:anti-repressor protein
MEMIKITETNGNKAVSARELHNFLEVKENLTDWNKRMLSYGFEEGTDYQAVSVFLHHENGTGGTTKKDYALTIDTAKEISMLQRTEKGKQARRYFIECEKNKPRTHLEVIKSEMALLIENEALKLDNERMKPRSEFVDIVFNTTSLIDIGEVAKILNLPYGRNTLFSVLREKGIFFKSKNEPMQQYISKGYFEVKEKFVEIGEKKRVLTVQTFATQKGLGFIAKTLGIIKAPTNKALKIA